MRLSTRQLAPALAAVFYGVFFTLGQALHYLPGMNHFEGSSSQGCCCCALHCEESGPKLNNLEQKSRGQEGGRRTKGASHDCPICELLALAQDRATHTPTILPGAPILAAVVDLSLPAAPQPFDLYSARGPPQRRLAGA